MFHKGNYTNIFALSTEFRELFRLILRTDYEKLYKVEVDDEEYKIRFREFNKTKNIGNYFHLLNDPGVQLRIEEARTQELLNRKSFYLHDGRGAPASVSSNSTTSSPVSKPSAKSSISTEQRLINYSVKNAKTVASDASHVARQTPKRTTPKRQFIESKKDRKIRLINAINARKANISVPQIKKLPVIEKTIDQSLSAIVTANDPPVHSEFPVIESPVAQSTLVSRICPSSGSSVADFDSASVQRLNAYYEILNNRSLRRQRLNLPSPSDTVSLRRQRLNLSLSSDSVNDS